MICNASNSQLEIDQAIKKATTRKSRAPKKQAIPEPLIEFGTKSEPGRVEILLPLRTVSEANCFEAWRNKHKRHKAQKRAVMFAMIPIKHLIQLPCKIKYTRYAPKTLDKFENLPMSFKYLNDQVCAEIMNDFRPGRADGSDQLTIEIDQVKSKEYAVKIEIIF